MVKITFLGSCRFSPYEILAKPDPLNPAYTVEEHATFNTDEEYVNACKIFYPAIEESDLVIVYAPDGIGHHTWLDMEKAFADGKRVIVIDQYGCYEAGDCPRGSTPTMRNNDVVSTEE